MKSRKFSIHKRASNKSPRLSELPFGSPQSPYSLGSPYESFSEAEGLGSPLIPVRVTKAGSAGSSSPEIFRTLDNPAASQTSFELADEIYESTLTPEHKPGSGRKKFVEAPQRRGSLRKTRISKNMPYFGGHKRAPVKDLFDTDCSTDIEISPELRGIRSPGLSSTFYSPIAKSVAGPYATHSRHPSPLFLSPKTGYRQNQYNDECNALFDIPEGYRSPQYKTSQVTIRRRPVGTPPSRNGSPATLKAVVTSRSRGTFETSESEDYDEYEGSADSGLSRSSEDLKEPDAESSILLSRPLTQEQHIMQEWRNIRKALRIEVNDEIAEIPRQKMAIPAGKVWRSQHKNFFPMGAIGMPQNRVVEIIKGNQRKLEARRHPETI